MSRSIQRAARMRALLTAETYHRALDHLDGEGPLIPDARQPNQTIFEAEVFHQLLDLGKRARGGHPRHPLGITHCTPLPHGIDLRMESRRQAAEVLQQVLPHRLGSDNDHADHAGITGLTVDGIRGSALELTVPGRNCRLTLSGLPGRGWKESLDRAERLQRDGHCGRPPVWSRPGSVPAGHQDRDAPRGHRRGSAWLGSWLLRRPGLFQQVTTPHLLEGHGGPGNWTLELCHLTTSPFEAESLTQLLRHPELGLPWAPTVRTCSRVLPDGTQHRSGLGEHWARGDDRSGQIILDLADPGRTVLDLRYHRDPVTLLHPAVRDAATARISHAVARHDSLRRLIGAGTSSRNCEGTAAQGTSVHP